MKSLGGADPAALLTSRPPPSPRAAGGTRGETGTRGSGRPDRTAQAAAQAAPVTSGARGSAYPSAHLQPLPSPARRHLVPHSARQGSRQRRGASPAAAPPCPPLPNSAAGSEQHAQPSPARRTRQAAFTPVPVALIKQELLGNEPQNMSPGFQGHERLPHPPRPPPTVTGGTCTCPGRRLHGSQRTRPHGSPGRQGAPGRH